MLESIIFAVATGSVLSAFYEKRLLYGIVSAITGSVFGAWIMMMFL